MSNPEPKPDSKAEKPTGTEVDARQAWKRPMAIGAATLLVAAGIGFGIGYLTRSGDSENSMTVQETRDQSEEQALAEVKREMTRQGFRDGIRSGRNHGIIAGGMAAESAVMIQVRQQAASQAQSAAAAAQSELAGIAAAPAPPVASEEPAEAE